jgi:hypothetical protein
MQINVLPARSKITVSDLVSTNDAPNTDDDGVVQAISKARYDNNQMERQFEVISGEMILSLVKPFAEFRSAYGALYNGNFAGLLTLNLMGESIRSINRSVSDCKSSPSTLEDLREQVESIPPLDQELKTMQITCSNTQLLRFDDEHNGLP